MSAQMDDWVVNVTSLENYSLFFFLMDLFFQIKVYSDIF